MVKKGRGPGKKPALVCTSIRLPKHVLEYFSQQANKQKLMRELLTQYVDSKLNQGERSE
jgi:hypothetical protein